MSTDVHFRPTDSALGAGVRSQQLSTQGITGPVGLGAASLDPKMRDVNYEATEMAAFEKGRMQGEMEAIRRMEAENHAVQLKQFPVEQQALNIQRPDIVEINRLTWLQRAAALLGEACLITALVLTIIWHRVNRPGYSWDNSERGAGTYGEVGFWNTGFLCNVLGLFFLAQAILLYRVLPLNTSAWFNRALYCFNYSCAIVCFILGLVAMVRTQPDRTFWGMDSWCYVLALTSVIFHGLYSMARALMEKAVAVKYQKWAEVNNHVDRDHALFSSPEQRRDHSTHNAAGRTVYAPAPHFPTIGRNLPKANMNVGAQVPAAPANAPRWAENPNTHAEDYFLMPRAKWGVASFVGMGAAICMILTAVQYVLAAGRANWAQDSGLPAGGLPDGMDENSTQAHLISTLGLMLFAGTLLIAYAAMPPRTTLVKNGILTERRSSVSHNAETRLGPNMV